MSNVTVQYCTTAGFSLPVMLIELKSKNIISIPSQIGCLVGCEFCPSSKNPFVRQLKADEMAALYRFGRSMSKNPDTPTLLSFTGEGEPLLNIDEINQVMLDLSDDGAIVEFRICMSGIKCQNLNKLKAPSNKDLLLQVSLHSPFDSVRQELIKNTRSIAEFSAQIDSNRAKFKSISWNYVLMRDFNDRDEDYAALMSVVPSSDTIKLNRLLGATPPFFPSGCVDQWISRLSQDGRKFVAFEKIANTITNEFFDDLTYDQMLNQDNRNQIPAFAA